MKYRGCKPPRNAPHSKGPQTSLPHYIPHPLTGYPTSSPLSKQNQPRVCGRSPYLGPRQRQPHSRGLDGQQGDPRLCPRSKVLLEHIHLVLEMQPVSSIKSSKDPKPLDLLTTCPHQANHSTRTYDQLLLVINSHNHQPSQRYVSYIPPSPTPCASGLVWSHRCGCIRIPRCWNRSPKLIRVRGEGVMGI